MTRPYHSIYEFPVWFYNLPPATLQQPASDNDRPPLVTLAIDVSGFLQATSDGVLKVEAGDGVQLSSTIDGAAITGEALAAGVPLTAGTHDIALTGSMSGEDWRLVPTWNGGALWESGVATVDKPRAIDAWLRPWGRWANTLQIGALLAVAISQLVTRAGDRTRWSALVEVLAAVAAAGRAVAMRGMPLLLLVAAALKLPRRLQNMFGAQLLIVVPFLAVVAMRGLGEIGRVTWYTIGDDWWLFQRFAYRIYLQGYWLEGGEPAFWFQPFYRWIAGALHMVFGDSSVGEFFWDGACASAGALFAFHVSRVVAGFRWGVVAAVATLAMFTIGPGWYLFGRGLSELTSAGLTYTAALLVLRGRHGHKWSLCAAGLCLAAAFYTRLNNLPFVAAAAAFSLPVHQAAGDWWRWKEWRVRWSRAAFAAVVIALALAVVLFSLRAYYYTGSFNPLSGTQAGARSIWQTTDEGLTPAQNLAGSRRLAPYKSNAKDFVRSFSYHDQMSGTPTRDEQGTRDRPYDLIVDFDEKKIDDLLGAFGVRPWLSHRPVVSVFVAMEQGATTYIVTADAERSLAPREALRAAAAKRGLTIVLPGVAALAKSGIDAAGLTALPSATLAARAAEQGGEVALVGRLVWDEQALGWATIWQMAWQDRPHRWQLRGVTFDEAFRRAIGGAAQILSGNGDPG